MKQFIEYLPESFLVELSEGPTDSQSPVSGAEASNKPNPANTVNGKRELNVGDPVVVSGNVKYKGLTGEVIDFGQNRKFVVVNLYRFGKTSFQLCDLEYDTRADEEHDDEAGAREIENLRKLSGY